jgi:hypothetical protein
MGKQVSYTVITVLDPKIPRQLAIDLLHSHEEVIRLNPLVTDVRTIETPQNASTDEFFAQWYEITERITFLPGFKKTLKFKVCWYDQPWGVQTHSLMGALFDLRCSYKIGGNQPGEPREPAELGVNKPTDGLYLREDINIELFIPGTAGFVKKEMQNSSATMISRMKRKAELLDDGRLLAMFEDGKLKTTKAGGMNILDTPASPALGANGTPPLPRTDTFSSQSAGRYSDLNSARSVHRHSGQPGYRYENADSIGSAPIAEMSGEDKPTFVAELPGSMDLAPQQPSAPRSRPVSTGDTPQQASGSGSRPVSTGGTPQFGNTIIRHVPPSSGPADDSNMHPPALRPA